MNWLQKVADDGKTMRRKMQRAVGMYLGRGFGMRSFTVDPEFGEDESILFGKPSGMVSPDGHVSVKDASNAIHELLHQAGFMPHGISEHLNEGITQIVAEDVGQFAHLPVVPSYPANTSYLRQYLFPLFPMPIRGFAKKYSVAPDKGKFLADLIWSRYGHALLDPQDWGARPYESMLNEIRRTLGTITVIEYLSSLDKNKSVG